MKTGLTWKKNGDLRGPDETGPVSRNSHSGFYLAATFTDLYPTKASAGREAVSHYSVPYTEIVGALQYPVNPCDIVRMI